MTTLMLLLFLFLFLGGTAHTNTSTGDHDGSVLRNVTMDNEQSFQNQGNYPFMYCDQTFLHFVSQEMWNDFHKKMTALQEEAWCDWEQVIRLYLHLTEKMTLLTEQLGCFYPNPTVEELFLQIHRKYFQHCPDRNKDFVDAPFETVLCLTLIPMCLVPTMVFLVVWKNKAYLHRTQSSG